MFLEDYLIVKNISQSSFFGSSLWLVLLQSAKEWIFYKYGHMVQNLAFFMKHHVPEHSYLRASPTESKMNI